MTWTVRIAPGEGIVCRREAAVLLAAPENAAQEKLLSRLIAALHEVVDVDPQAPGRRLARALAGIMSSAEPEEVPAFCLMAAVDDGIATLVVGEAEVQLQDGEVLSGRDVATWVDRIVRDTDVLIARVGDGAEVDGRTYLEAGVVPGSGLALTLGDIDFLHDEDHDDAQGQDHEDEDDDVVEFEEGDEGTDEDDASYEDDPSDDEDDSSPEGELSPFARSLLDKDRPALGGLVLEDGEVYPMTEDYVMGREPEHAEEVRGGAVPLALDDKAATLSRVHAKVEVRHGQVQVTDLGSANGTYVARRGDREWTRLEPYVPRTILHDTRITVGGRSILYDAHTD